MEYYCCAQMIEDGVMDLSDTHVSSLEKKEITLVN